MRNVGFMHHRALSCRRLINGVLLLCVFFAGDPRSFFHSPPTASAVLLQGCNFGLDLCDIEETCIPDGLFGQCYAEAGPADEQSFQPIILRDGALTGAQSELLRAEMNKLAALGFDWQDDYAQCVLLHFKLAVFYQIEYDPEFCAVRNPSIIWALIQRFHNAFRLERQREQQQRESENVANERDISPPEQQISFALLDPPSRGATRDVAARRGAAAAAADDDKSGDESRFVQQQQQPVAAPLRAAPSTIQKSVDDDDNDDAGVFVPPLVYDDDNDDANEKTRVVLLPVDADDVFVGDDVLLPAFQAAAGSDHDRLLAYVDVDELANKLRAAQQNQLDDSSVAFAPFVAADADEGDAPRVVIGDPFDADDLLAAVANPRSPNALFMNDDGDELTGVRESQQPAVVAVLDAPPAIAASAAAATSLDDNNNNSNSVDENESNKSFLKQIFGLFERGEKHSRDEKAVLSPKTAHSLATTAEQKQLNEYINKFLERIAQNGGDIKANKNNELLTAHETPSLNDRQLGRLVSFIRLLQDYVRRQTAENSKAHALPRTTNDAQQQQHQQTRPSAVVDESEEEVLLVPPISADAKNDQDEEQFLLLKKDTERFNAADMGLANTHHKIVKGKKGSDGKPVASEDTSSASHRSTPRPQPQPKQQTIPPGADRVYMRLTKPNTLGEEELYGLIGYLDETIAADGGAYFDEFVYDDSDSILSFRINRVAPPLPLVFGGGSGGKRARRLIAAQKSNAFLDVEDDGAFDGGYAAKVAQTIYMRRKDIQRIAGVYVNETGIWTDNTAIPVYPQSAAAGDDGVWRWLHHRWLYVSLMAVGCATICVLCGTYFLRTTQKISASERGGTFSEKKATVGLFPQMIGQLDAKACSVYEDLCRTMRRADGHSKASSQQAAAGSIAAATFSSSIQPPPPAYEAPSAIVAGQRGGATTGGGSRHSSTSSWFDDASSMQQAYYNLDVNTGHVVLSFLQEHLSQPEEISAQWRQLVSYKNVIGQTTIASATENACKNLASETVVLPYDESVVLLENATDSSNEGEQKQTPKYINASKIIDSDPRQPNYIAAQHPLSSTVDDFWQMIWEFGVVQIVNLCTPLELSETVVKYWPDEGQAKQQFGHFEVCLVSEHNFSSDDYIVRSLYLKNINTGETRTITQFHYLAWSEGKAPRSSRSLLEFRRKVNKSYRGCSSPILVHSVSGGGRTGTYLVIDMVATRIARGVKEMNIAAAVEHLRDQRQGCVSTEEQYMSIFSCVADEVLQLLQTLQHLH